MTNYRVETADPRTISIELPERPFGVLVSGGLDSTLLLHLVAIEAARKNVSFFTCNVARGNGTEAAAKATVERIAHQYDVTLCHRQLCTTGGHAVQVLNAAESYLATGEVDSLFVADTTNPKDLPNGPTRQPEGFTANGWVFPFLHCNKSHMVALAASLRLADVFAYSHTCTEWADGECGVCWQCRERAWGFAQNGLIDPLSAER